MSCVYNKFVNCIQIGQILSDVTFSMDSVSVMSEHIHFNPSYLNLETATGKRNQDTLPCCTIFTLKGKTTYTST